MAEVLLGRRGHRFYFEADENGVVLRQAELEGPKRKPIAAADYSDFPDARTDGADAVEEYTNRYGGLAIGAISSWEPDFPHEEISAEEFEDVWRKARTELEQS